MAESLEVQEFILRERARAWNSIDVTRELDHALTNFAHRFYSVMPGGYSESFRQIPPQEQLRVLRAFESALGSMRQIMSDEIRAHAATTKKTRRTRP